MIYYYIIYLIPVVLSWSYVNKGNNIPNRASLPWLVIGFLFALVIGFRHEVGGDWSTYIQHFNSMVYYQFQEILQHSDPGYYIINWYFSNWGLDIYYVNFICGVIFMVGLIIFARRQPNPWLAISVAVPYLIVVIAMGYTRQAVSIGFVFWGLAALEKNKFKQFLVLLALAATFHKSAVIMIGLGVFLQGKGKLTRLFAVGIVGFGLWSSFLAQYQDQLWKNYVEVQMQSQGAMIRVAMNLVPSIIFILYHKAWKLKYNDYTFWYMIAIGSIASVFFVTFASTATDRVALYFTPIQVVVYSRLPYLLQNKISIKTTTALILLYYLLVMYVWLNYASHAHNWLPYQSSLFENIL